MENRNISIEDWLSLVREGSVLPVTIPLHGRSMEPLVRCEKDLLDISPLNGTPRLFDIIVFRNGKRYCAHRVYRVGKNGVYTLGDNVRRSDGFIRNEDIVGVATRLRRDGRIIPLDSFRMRLYGAVRVALFPLRLAVKNITAVLWRIYCRLFRKGKG